MMRHLFMCLCVVWSMCVVSTVHAQQDPQGTLYVYVDASGKEVTSATPRQDLEFVERITPTSTVRVSTPSSAAGGLRDRVNTYLDLVNTIAPEHGVDPTLVLAIIYAESYFDPNLTSSAGAMGLMQIMPSNARRFDIDDPYDPAQNITAGCMLLARLNERYDGDVPLVLAAYSAGDVHVRNHGGVPPFSVKYIARVVRAHARITTLLLPPP